MKYLFTLTALTLILAGCGADNQQEAEEVPAGETETVQEENNEITESETANEEGLETEESNQEEAAEEANNEQTGDMEEFPEYEVLTQQIDLDNLEQTVVEDNPGKRVIIFATAEGEEEYKSVYIKETERLKVIPLGPGEPLYNDTI